MSVIEGNVGRVAVAVGLAFWAVAAQAQGPKAEAGAGGIRGLVNQAAVNGGQEYPGMGFRLTSPEGIARSAKFKIKMVARGERPRRVLLTQWLPPVGNQGNQGSCAGWATAYYCYTYSVAKQRKLTTEQRGDPRFQFSPAFLYHKVNGGVDSGSKMRDIFDVLGSQGCATLAEMPYSDKDFTSAPSSEAVARADRYKARSVGCLFTAGKVDLDALKTYLAEVQQPFVAAIPIFTDFPKGKLDSSFVYSLSVPATKANFKGGHAVTIVGYDDDKKAFRMVNSWGPGWGDDGFIWLSEEFMKEWCLEGWAQLPGGVVARDVVRGASSPIRASRNVTLEMPSATPSKTPRLIKR